MDHTANTYIPLDRRRALAAGISLPQRTGGAALVADVSGFTPLTDSLTSAFGPHRGAEELTRYLDLVYDALIEQVSGFGGSVVSFSGDAITAWFDQSEGGRASLRAVAAALAMQSAMQTVRHVQLPDGSTLALAMKVAVATGEARRFLLGDPSVQVIDSLAGSLVERLAAGESIAHRGEVLIDQPTAAALDGTVRIIDWRTDSASGDRFALINALNTIVEPLYLPAPPPLEPALVAPWLLPAVRARLSEGMGEFLTELRPVVALFLHFEGIDFEGDESAGHKLDTYIRYIQRVLARYEGTLIQLTIGDKGSYLYAAFGAPVAHEDDTIRAASVALELRAPPRDIDFVRAVRIGISLGTMRVGAYGGSTRRTYGALGDDVNLAARLMQHASPGEVLGSGRAQMTTAEVFAWQSLAPLQVKGKKKPIVVARLVGKPQVLADAVGFSGALVGRELELSNLIDFFQPLAEGRFAGLCTIAGEPGIGKSRLAYELQKQIRRQFRLNWFTCPTDQILRVSLHPFKHFLREYFDQYMRSTEDDNRRRFDEVFDSLLSAITDPDLSDRLNRLRPYLGALIDLHWSDSLYERAEPRERFEGMLLAFKTFLEAESRRQPVIIQIEDSHWIDADSRALIAYLLRDSAQPAWGVLLAGRHEAEIDPLNLPIHSSIQQYRLNLPRLSPGAMRQLAARTLKGQVADALALMLMQKTNGNPFFIEQLVLEMRERGAILRGNDDLWTVARRDLEEVPTGINAVLVSRLDRLPPQVKAVVQVASVLGQTFRLPVLSRMLNDDAHLLDKIHYAEAESIWYILDASSVQFQHNLLRDAAYEMQLRSRLHELHALAGQAIEQLYAGELHSHAVDLAYHFGKAEDSQRGRFYARLAGEVSAARFANDEAVQHLTLALELTPPTDPQEQYVLLLAREQVYDLQGNRAAQLSDLDTLSALADQLSDNRKRAEVALRRANYAEVTSDYAKAIAAAERAVELAQSSLAVAIEANSWLTWGRALGWQAYFEPARERLERALHMAQSSGMTDVESASLRNLGIVAFAQGDYHNAQEYQLRALRLSRAIADRRGETYALNNLAQIARERSDNTAAQFYQESALRLSRETGDRQSENSVLNLSRSVATQLDRLRSREFHEEALRLSRDIGNRRGQVNALNRLGLISLEQGDPAGALALLEQALTISREIGFRRGEIKALAAIGRLHHAAAAHQPALDYLHQAIHLAGSVGARPEQADALLLLGDALLAAEQVDAALDAFQQVVAAGREMDQTALVVSALAGLSRAAMFRDDVAAASLAVEELLKGLQTVELSALESAATVCLTAFRVLNAAQDSRAAQILDTAYQFLHNEAAQIPDETYRRAYLENIPTHRELLAAWALSRQH